MQAGMFTVTQQLDVTWAVVPPNAVLVVDVFPIHGIKPIFSHGEQPMNLDSLSVVAVLVVPTFIPSAIGFKSDRIA